MLTQEQTAIIQELIRKGREQFEASRGTVAFDTGFPEAEELLNDIDSHPHFFVLGCVMDRQVTATRAWAIPYCVGKDLGGFDFPTFSKASLEQIKASFRNNGATGKSLHRFADRMADLFYLAIIKIAHEYAGGAAVIWAGNPKSAAVIRRFLEFKGVGPKIATMAANILARDFKVPMSELSSIDISADRQVMKYFIVHGLLRPDAKNEELIYLARELYPAYPGILDSAAWEGGQSLRVGMSATRQIKS